MAAVLLWLSIAVTLNFVVGASAPQVVLSWWPWSATARAAIAVDELDGEPSSAEVTRARQLARSALLRAPLSVEAARALALAEAREGDIAQANHIFAYAETLSRRDLPTQLWMIESAVVRDDIGGALHHYDRALRTSRSAADLLMPTLVAAASDPAINAELAEILAARPNWWMLFFSRAIPQIDNLDALANLARAVDLNVADRAELSIASTLMRRLLKEDAYTLAFTVHQDLVNAKTVTLLRDGTFDDDRALSAFDWTLRDEVNVYSRRESVGVGEARLALYADGGDGGWLARQLLVLSPGRYRLSGLTGDTGTTAAVTPRIILRCAGGKTQLVQQAVPPTSANKSFAFEFVVPAGCAAQQLDITTAPAAETDAWIDSLTIQAVG